MNRVDGPIARVAVALAVSAFTVAFGPNVATAQHGTPAAPAAHGADDETEGSASEDHGPASEHGAGEHGAGEHHEEPAELGEILTSTSFLATVINFAIFAFLVVRFAGGPIGSFFSGRSTEVARELEEAKRLKEEANAKKAEYEARLAKLDAELDEMKAEMVRSGEKERDRIVSEAREKAERMRRDAAATVDQRIRALRADLHRETVHAALDEAAHLLEAQTGPDDQARLSKAYVDLLGERAGQALGGRRESREGSAS